MSGHPQTGHRQRHGDAATASPRARLRHVIAHVLRCVLTVLAFGLPAALPRHDAPTSAEPAASTSPQIIAWAAGTQATAPRPNHSSGATPPPVPAPPTLPANDAPPDHAPTEVTVQANPKPAPSATSPAAEPSGRSDPTPPSSTTPSPPASKLSATSTRE